MSSVSTINEMDARMAILALEGEYQRAWDVADTEDWAAAAWANVFTEDGVFEMAFDGDTPDVIIRGREALIGFCTDTHRMVDSVLHNLSIPSLTFGERDVQGWINFECKLRCGAESISVSGVYQVLYVLTEAGWRMKRRVEKMAQKTSVTLYDYPALLKDM